MDFSGRNLKRVAEVWLDDYKEMLYRSEPERYSKIDPGDLTKQFEIKNSLNCKPFKYFLDVVVPEMVNTLWYLMLSCVLIVLMFFSWSGIHLCRHTLQLERFTHKLKKDALECQGVLT